MKRGHNKKTVAILYVAQRSSHSCSTPAIFKIMVIFTASDPKKK